jgi:hypothetical protein
MRLKKWPRPIQNPIARALAFRKWDRGYSRSKSEPLIPPFKKWLALIDINFTSPVPDINFSSLLPDINFTSLLLDINFTSPHQYKPQVTPPI